MKRISKYAALFAALAGLLITGCDSSNSGGNEPSSPLTVTNGTVISCDRTTKGSVEIPSGVTAIGDYAFNGCTGLTEISIPSSVKSVGQNAFAGCYGLTVRYAGTKTQWEKLGVDTKYVTVVCCDDTVGCEGQSDVLTIVDNVVMSCSQSVVGTVEIPDGVTAIEGYAFAGCTGLTEISIPSSVKSVGQNAFAGCYGLTVRYAGTKARWKKLEVDAKYVTVVCRDGTVDGEGQGENAGSSYTVTFYPNVPPNAVGELSPIMQEYAAGSELQIPDGLFVLDGYRLVGWATNANDNTVSCPIGSSFTVFENRSFYAVWEAVIDMPVNGLVIKDNIVVEFRSDSGISEVTIPDGVTAIGSSAFRGCAGVTSVVIPYSVTSIGNYAFQGCTGLTSMNIPASVTSIGSSAFVDCSGLASITVDDSNPNYSSQDGILYNKYKTTLIYVPQAIRSIAIIDSVTYIAENAFYGCKYLTSVKIPSKVTSIGKGAFSGCRSLQEMTLPFVGSSVSKYATTTYLGYIFGGTDNTAVPSSLKVVIILDGMTTIKKNAFSGCSYLRNVTIPDSVTSIENGAFSGCSNLTEMTLPFAGATKDGTDNTYFDYIFGGTTSYSGSSSYNSLVPQSLKKVTITSSIGDYAFMKCKGLTSVTIGTGASSIGTYAFYGCSGLTSLTIENGVSSIGSWAFRDCKGLTSLVLPNSVTLIGARAFNMCTGLTTVTMTASLQVIGDSAFSGCMALMNIIFKGTPAQWSAIEKGSYWDYSTGGVEGYWYENKFYTVTYDY